MKLQNLVCTTKQGEILKELGIKQNSLFYWTGEKWGIMPKSSCDFTGSPTSLFTVGELGFLLPIYPTTNATHSWYHRHCWKGHSVGYSEIGGKNHIESPWYESEAEARAYLLIFIIQCGYISVDEINNRIP